MTFNARRSGAVTPVVMESKIPKETHRFTWNIANFAAVKESEELVDALSATFDMGQSIGLPVTFEAFLRVGAGEDKGWIGWWLNVFRAPKDVKEMIVNAGLKIGDYVEVEEEDALQYKVPGQGWGWKDVIRQNEDVSKLPLDANGSLPIQITVTLYITKGIRVSIADVMPKFRGIFTRKLSEDLEILYKEPCLVPGAPVTISMVSRDGQEFPANSAHLAARSPVFRLMFQTPMKEVKEGVVKMEDIGGEALEVFLHFLHTATLKDNWKEPGVMEELTCAAHKYLMQDLFEFLDEAIGLVCAPENCANMIHVAHRLELKKATEALLKMHQDQWKQATEVQQMMKLFQK